MTQLRGLRSTTLHCVAFGVLCLVAPAARADYRDLLVTNLGNGAVSDFNPATGAENTPFVPGATGVATASPRGIAIGANNDVYVGDIGKGALQIFNGTGTLINSVAFPVPNPAQQGGFQPQGMAFSPTNGLLYVDSGSAPITAATSTTLVSTFNTATNTFAPFTLTGLPAGLNSNFTGVGSAIGLTFDSAGNLYLASSDNNQVLEFNASGAYLKSFTTPTPSGIAINNAAGILYAVDGSATGQTIQEFNTTTGALVGSITNAALLGSAAGGLLYDPATNRLYAAGDLKPSVFAFNATSGSLDPTFGTGGIATVSAPYPAPFDVPLPIYLALNSAAAVPEPSSLALMGMGVVGVVGAAVRKGRRASA